MNAHDPGCGITVDLFALDTLNMDDPAATVHLHNLALAALVGSPSDDNLVVLSNGERLDVVFGTKLLAERSSHHLTADVGGSREVGLAALATRRADA